MIQASSTDLKLKFRILKVKYSTLRANCHILLLKQHELRVKHDRMRAELNWHQKSWTDEFHSDNT